LANLLIADDEAELLELLRFSLDAAGYNVTTATDGRKALDLAKSRTFDLVILDVMMPHIDGYHVAQDIAQNPKSPPILLLTSRDFSQDQTAIKGSGASAFLSKPFEITELLEVVKSLVTGKK
jgi:two-component system, OmpR family, alkaline phosphatase synthesis response regulator PhoP